MIEHPIAAMRLCKFSEVTGCVFIVPSVFDKKSKLKFTIFLFQLYSITIIRI